ncbi:MAG: tetratricopeptide repeat protein [Candidatus Shapirobacteria bacterium]|nr:tetratricopeptide repeat protein [Candidatus Shapirobacteria bacterium]
MIYLLYVGINRVRINWTKFILGTLVLSILFVIFAMPYIKYRIGVVNSGYNSSESVFYDPFFQYPTGISKYLQLLAVPVDLTLYHTMYTFPWQLNWFILLLYLATTIYFFFKDKRYFFALAFIIAAVLPSIMPVKVSWLVAERYMFLGSLGFCLFLGLIITDLWRYSKIIIGGVLGLLLVLFSIKVYIRNIDWQTNHKLWVNTCQVSPNSHNAWNNIGDDYDKLNDPTNAIKGFTQSTIVKPNYADAYHNRANIFFKIGRLDLARESYNVALNFSPELYQTYLSLTQIDLMEGKSDLALQHSQAALKLQPENPQAVYVVGVVYAQVGKLTEAETIFENLLKQIPDYQPAKQALQQLKTLMATQSEKKN